jgi:hypothetical protein
MTKKSIPTFQTWQSPGMLLQTFGPSNDNDSLTYGDEALIRLAAENFAKLRSYQHSESALAGESPVCRNRRK